MNCANFAGPITDTSNNASRVTNGPFALRYATIRDAKTGPIPSNSSNSFALALLIAIGPVFRGGALRAVDRDDDDALDAA